MPPVESARLRQLREQFLSVSYDTRKPEEGFTEALRVWMTQRRLGMDTVPDAMNALTVELQKNLTRREWKALLKAQEDMHAFVESGTVSWHASRTEKLGLSPGAARYTSADMKREKYIDKFHPFLRAERMMNRGQPNADGPWEEAHRLAGNGEIFDAITLKGVPTYNRATGERSYSPDSEQYALREIFKPHTTIQDRLETATYFRARMAQELFPQRIIAGGKVVAPEDFAEARNRPTSEWHREYRAAKAEERAVYEQLDVKNQLKELKKLERKLARTEDPDLVLDQIERIKQQIEPWMEAVEATKEAARLLRQGQLRDAYAKGESREKAWLPENIHSGLELETPQRIETANKLMEFNRRLLKFALDTGVIGQENVDNFRRQVYIHGLFKQQHEGVGKRFKTDPVEGGSGIRTLRGSARQEMEMLDTLVYGASKTLELGLENLVKQKLERFVFRQPGGGAFAQRVEPGLLKTTVKVADVLKDIRLQLRKMGMNNAQIEEYLGKNFLGLDGDLERVGEWSRQKPHGENILTVFHDGKPTYYEVHDLPLMRAVQHFRPDALEGAYRLADKVRTFYQGTVVLNPEFMWLSNAPRDLMYSFIGSRTGVRSTLDAFTGLMHSMKNDDLYWEYIVNGGGHATRYHSTLDHQKAIRRHAMKHGIKHLVTSPKDLAMALRAIQPLRAGQWMGRHFEVMSKLGEYQNAVRQGNTKTHASFLGREVNTDFGVHGADKNMQGIIRSMPFVSAMVNGQDNAYRKFFTREHGGARRQAAIIAKLTAYAGFTSGIAMANFGEDWYEKIPRWKKLAYTFFPTGVLDDDGEELILTIPKPFEPGMVSNMLTGTAEMLYRGNGADRELFADLGHSLWLNFQVGPSPILQVPFEWAANTSLLTGIPTESAQMERRLRAERFNARTPQVFKEWGQFWAKKGYPNMPFSSPAKMNQAFRSSFGAAAFFAVMLSETTNPDGTAMHIDEYPFIRRMVMRENRYDDNYSKLWDAMGEASLIRNSISHALRSGDVEKGMRYMQEQNPAAGMLEPVGDFLGKIGQMREHIISGRMDERLKEEQRKRGGPPERIKVLRRRAADDLIEQQRAMGGRALEMFNRAEEARRE
jgi:hypothetical protein